MPAGSKRAIGTELNLVQHSCRTKPLTKLHISRCKRSVTAQRWRRIDLPHLVWAMENLAACGVSSINFEKPGRRAFSQVARAECFVAHIMTKRRRTNSKAQGFRSANRRSGHLSLPQQGDEISRPHRDEGQCVLRW
jgi:hypothetical protein